MTEHDHKATKRKPIPPTFHGERHPHVTEMLILFVAAVCAEPVARMVSLFVTRAVLGHEV